MEVKKAKIGNALTSAASDHVVAVSEDIYDESKGRYQSDINEDVLNRLSVLQNRKIVKVVASLPSEVTDEYKNAVILVPQPGGISGNYFTEYIWNNTRNEFEQIGSIQTSVDLSGYYDKNEIDQKILNVETSQNELTAALADGSFLVGKASNANTATSVGEKGVNKTSLDTEVLQMVTAVDNLTTANTISPLSANQGKILKDTIDSVKEDIEDKLLHIENKLFPLEVTLSVYPSIEEYTGANENFTIGWTTKIDGKSVIPKSISLTVGGIAVPVDTSDTSKEVSANNDANISLTIEAEGRSATISGKINFAYPAYTSVVADNFVVNEANVKGLTKMSLVDSKARSHTYVAPKLQKVVYAYAKSYGALTGIVDANNVNLIANYTRNEITINGIAYYVYITTERFSTNGSITYKYQ